jgi:uncharacterized protein
VLAGAADGYLRSVTGDRLITEDGKVPPAEAPHGVRLAVNVHHWDDITFLHWPIEPDEVQNLLPPGLHVDIYAGTAWVGITPFFIRVRPLGLPLVPPRWAFPETNMRTYVIGPDGRQGIWFLRMEVTASWFVLALRTIGLPYVRQQMSVDAAGDVVQYRSWPTHPGGAGGHDIAIRPGRLVEPPSGGSQERFLTARWDAFHRVGRSLLRTSAEHEPWHLRTAEVERCNVGAMFDAIGLSTPAEPPLAHTSPGVVVRLGLPRLLQSTRTVA